MKNRTVRTLIFSAIVFVLAFGFAELLVRLLLPAPGMVATENDQPGLIVDDAVRGYAYTPDYKGSHTRDGRAIHFETNELGLRDRPIRLDGATRILAVGDSFTAGWGVEAEEAWPAQLEAALNKTGRPVRVINAGVSGYSPRQARQALEHWLKILKPDLVLFAVFPAVYWRVEDPFVPLAGQLVRQSERPLLSVQGTAVIYRPFLDPRLRAVDAGLSRYSWAVDYLFRAGCQLAGWTGAPDRPTWSDDPRTRMAPVIEELSLARDAAERTGAGFAVLVVSAQQPDGSFSEPTRTFARIVGDECQKQRIPALDMLPILAARSGGEPIFRTPGDLHWTPRAHALAGARFADFLTDERLVPRPTAKR